MISFVLAGLVAGFALGWGAYWYLQQEERERWDVGRLLYEYGQPAGKLLSRLRRPAATLLSRLHQVTPAGDTEVFERARSLLRRDAVERSSTTPISRISEPDPTASVDDSATVEAKADVDSRPSAAASDADSTEEAPEILDAEVYQDATVAYCLNCQTRRPIHNEQRTRTRTGRIAVRGTCGVCGNELFTFVSDE